MVKAVSPSTSYGCAGGPPKKGLRGIGVATSGLREPGTRATVRHGVGLDIRCRRPGSEEEAVCSLSADGQLPVGPSTGLRRFSPRLPFVRHGLDRRCLLGYLVVDPAVCPCSTETRGVLWLRAPTVFASNKDGLFTDVEISCWLLVRPAPASRPPICADRPADFSISS
jgi:hypothetical protein